MPINPNDITPISEPAATPAAPAAPAEEGDTAGLPEELLAQPFMNALLQGKPAAVYVQNESPPPEAQLILDHADALGEAGFRIYPSTTKPVTVFFNALALSPDDLKAADEGGKLDAVAVPFEELQEVFAGARKGVETAPTDESGAPMAPSAAPAPANTPPTNPKLAAARIKNMSPGTPTSGPAPGQGRLLNNILKPVV